MDGKGKRKSSGFGAHDNTQTGFFPALTTLESGDGAAAVGSAPDADSGSQKGKAAIEEKLAVGDGVKVTGTGQTEDRENSGGGHDFEDKIENICSFHISVPFFFREGGVYLFIEHPFDFVLVLIIHTDFQNARGFSKKIEQLFVLGRICPFLPEKDLFGGETVLFFLFFA